jgi:GNAT superfamily N-acetyltransferase
MLILLEEARKAAHGQGQHRHPNGHSRRREDIIGPAGGRLWRTRSSFVRFRSACGGAAADVARKSEAAGERELLYRRIDGAAAGCGGWTIDKPGSGEIVEGVGHIRHFATHPAHLRKGVARLLLEHCLAEARAAGIHIMMSQSTLPAEKFYAAAGFRPIGPIEVEMGPGVVLPAVEMQRRLA